MPVHPAPADLDDLIRRYEAGETAQKLANERGIYVYVVTRWLREANVPLRSRSDRLYGAWKHRYRASDRLPAEELVRRYLSGESGKVLAESYGVNRTAINAVLRRAGVMIRGRSAGMVARWAGGESPDRLLRAAWKARRGTVVEAAEARHRSEGRQRVRSGVGRYEAEVAEALQRYGLSVVEQMAVGPYNVDVALDAERVAVEIFTGGVKRPAPRGRSVLQKFEDLLDGNWTVVRVIARTHVDVDGLCQYLIALAEAVRRDEAAWRGYGVVRGDGQPVPRRRSQFDDLPAIARPHRADEAA